MKSFLILICAATLAGASFAAQSAPAGDQQRIVAELLQMAQQRHAAGDVDMARALTEQASRMMGGQEAVGAADWLRAQKLEAFGYTSEPVIQDAQVRELTEAARAYEVHGMEMAALAEAELSQLSALSALGYMGAPAEHAQDDLHASLRQIRQELQALRAEVSALRAELAGQRSGDPFRGGAFAPGGPGAAPSGTYYFEGPMQGGQQGGFFHAPAPSGQPEMYYFQGGAAPGPSRGGQSTPSGTWEWRPSGPGQHPGASPQPAPPGGGSGAWQRHQAESEMQAAAAAHEANATAATAAHEAHAAAMDSFHAAGRALHDAFGGGAATPAATGANVAPVPATPTPPATPATPRTSAGAGSRPHNLF
jgi:hypothetical protein